MAVFRVERTRDYTVMCNHHLKDSNLSLKAKGLLSMMLSLPDEWNYTTRGLAAICKEGVDAIGKTLKELELAGYIIRRQLRGKDGRISDTEYTIFEKPRKPSPPDTTLPDTENPYLDNPDTEAPDTDNPAQLNTKKSNTQKSNTDLSSTHSFFLPAADGMTDGFEKKAEIREQIEYDILCQQYDRMQLDELVEIMLEVAMNRSPTVKIGRDAEYHLHARRKGHGRYPREHHPRLEYASLSHGGAVQFRFHHRQPLCHAGQSRFSRRPLKAVIFHARFREKGFDTDETPPCLHHRSVERE